MRWPFDRRAAPTHAWGLVAMGTAGLVAIPAVLATLHANDAQFRWWWPTDWMIIPFGILLLGLALLVVPVQRSLHPRVASAELPQAARSSERQRALLAAHKETIRVNNLEALRSVYALGNMYQARLRELGPSDRQLPRDRSIEIADWETSVRATIIQTSRFHDAFTFWVQQPMPDTTIASYYARMGRELSVLASAIREREQDA